MKGKRNRHVGPARSPPSDTEYGAAATGNASENSSKEQDRYLPIANVSRIIKKSLPANAKISKEAKVTVQECVSEFISFITGEASDKCHREKRKTVNGDDLLWAMATLGFENYVEPLKHYLNKYREIEGERNSMARQGDHQSPTEAGHRSYCSDQVLRSINSTNGNLSNFNETFFPLGPGAVNQGVVGYGEKNVGGRFNMETVNESGEANGSRVFAGSSHGVQW